MKIFEELGLSILERWRRADFDPRVFPDIAATALAERSPEVSALDLVRWVHQTPVLVRQTDIDSNFGQPPITVFSCEPFYIEVLFWVDGTTAIHQHAFSGAFYVMEGSSIHSTFRFSPERRYSDKLSLGRLEALESELLPRGAVRPIHSGAGFIHSLFHLERPSISVVVRTPSEPSAQPQYSYTRSGIAYDPFTKSESMTKRAQTLDLLHSLQHAELETIARESIAASDSFVGFQLLQRLRARIEPHERYAELLRDVRPTHPELVDAFVPHVEGERREEAIVARRQLLRDKDHRLFLGLLLNVLGRCKLLDMVRAARPGADPVDTVLGWIREIERLDAIHAWAYESVKERHPERRFETGPVGDRRVLDFETDATTLEILRRRLLGATEEEIVAHALEGAPADTTVTADDRLRRLCGLRSSVLLRGIWVE